MHKLPERWDDFMRCARCEHDRMRIVQSGSEKADRLGERQLSTEAS